MFRTRILAASLATGLAISGAYALSAQAAPTPTPKPSAAAPDANKPIAKDRIAQKRAGEAEAGFTAMKPDKQSYAVGDNYTVTMEVTTNTDGAYVVGYNQVTGATCQGSGSTTLNFSGTNGNPTSKTMTFTCKVNSFPVNGTVTLKTPNGVENLTPKANYTIGGKLPDDPKPTATPTKPSTGGLAKTGV